MEKLDIQRDTSDLSKELRDWFFDDFVNFIDCPQTDLSMIQNFLIPQMLKDQVLDIFLSEIPLKIRQEGPKNMPHSGFLLVVVTIARVEPHPTCVYASSIHACISLKCELSVRNMIKRSHSLRLRYAIILQNRKQNLCSKVEISH